MINPSNKLKKSMMTYATTAEMIAARAQYNQTLNQVIFVEENKKFYKKKATSAASLDSDYDVLNPLIPAGASGSNLVPYDAQFATRTFAINDLAIYQGVMYKNLTGTTHVTLAPDSDTTNWEIARTPEDTSAKALQAFTLVAGTNDYVVTSALLNTSPWDKHVMVLSNGLEYHGIRDRDFEATWSGTAWTITVDGVGGDNYYQAGDVITVSNIENTDITVTTASTSTPATVYATYANLVAATPAIGTAGFSTTPARSGAYTGTGWAIDSAGIREWDTTDAGRGVYTAINQFVTFNGMIYKKITGNATTNNPTTDTTNWKPQTFGATVYNALAYYNINDVVLDTTDNNFYRAISIVNDGGTSNLPSATPASWAVVQAGGIDDVTAFTNVARNAFASSNITYNYNTTTGVATALSGGSTTNDHGWYATTSALFVKNAGTFVYYAPHTNANTVTTVSDTSGNVYTRGVATTVANTVQINGVNATAYNFTASTNNGFLASEAGVSLATHFMNTKNNAMYLEKSGLMKYSYGRLYAVNDLVNYNGSIYKCIGTGANLTGAAGTSLPTVDTTNWETLVETAPADALDGVKELFYVHAGGSVSVGATTNMTLTNPFAGGTVDINEYHSFDLYQGGVYIARVDRDSGARRWSVTNKTAATVQTTVAMVDTDRFMLVCR